MKTALVCAAALALLAGCGKKTETAPATQAPGDETQAANSDAAPEAPPAITAEDLLPDGFPRPTAAYAGVFDLATEGGVVEAKIAADGATQRIEFPPGVGIGRGQTAWSQVLVVRNYGERISMWPEGEGAPKMAALVSRNDMGALAATFGVDPEKAKVNGKRIGADTVAGERCAEWEVGADEEGGAPTRACVTRDGIVLRVAEVGGPPAILAKSISRGAQAPALFAAPAGYEEVNMGECMRAAGDMMAAMREGRAPKVDMAKMQRCQEAGEKFGTIFGG